MIPQDPYFLNDIFNSFPLKSEECREFEGLDWFLYRRDGSDYIFVDRKKAERILGGTLDSFGPEEFDLDATDYLCEVARPLKRVDKSLGFYSA